MTVLRPEAFAKGERLTTQVQSKVTPSEFERLVGIRDELQAAGFSDVTISSLVRTFVVTGIRAYEADLEAGQ